jgi:hypothetical protein
VPLSHKNCNRPCASQHLSQSSLILIALSPFITIVLLTYPVVVELLICMGEHGCFHPISVKMLRSGTISYATMYSAPVSASEADE